MRLLTPLIPCIIAANAATAQVQSELPLGASNCAIAQALNIALPAECVDPPLGQKRGIVIRLDSQIRTPSTTKTITVPKVSKQKRVVKSKPKPVPVSHQAAKSENGYFIHFALNSFDLEPDYKEHLKRLSTVLSSDAMQKTCLRVTGHTDTTGTTEYNQKLSQKRAVMVGTYLAEVGQIDTNRIQISALGESQPLPNIAGSDPHNRRVAFSTKESETGCN